MWEEGSKIHQGAVANLKKLQQEGRSMEEILEAEEQLYKIEESMAEIIYKYNLARIQYRNHIGDYVY